MVTRLLHAGCVIVRNDTGIDMTTLPADHLAMYRHLLVLVRSGELSEAERYAEIMEDTGLGG